MGKKVILKNITILFIILIPFYLMRNYFNEIISLKFIISQFIISTLICILFYNLIRVSKKLRKKLYNFLFKESERDENSRIKKIEVKELQDIIIKYYIQRRELETAKEVAETQGRAKEIFLQNMSHEIRTPLNGIVITSELLKYTELNEKQQRYVATIGKASNTLIGVINNILDYSKLQVQKTAINKIAFNIREIISELKSFFISGSKEELFILFTISEDVPEVIIGDSFRLKQVLINLIGNAFKFTKKGYIVMEVSMKNRSKKTCEILFEIMDTGIGISEDKKISCLKALCRQMNL